MTWNKEFSNAPKGTDQLFLVKLPDGNVTTGYYYWYVETEEGHVKFEFWALHDAVRDCPLDDSGTPEDQGLEWMPIP